MADEINVHNLMRNGLPSYLPQECMQTPTE